MKSEWLPYAVLRAASLLVPGDQRAEWLDGWRSELWYIPRGGATFFCLGSFADALWLRRNNLNQVKRTRTHFESPLSCLAFLATLAAVSSLIAILLPGPQRGPWPAHLSARDLPAGSLVMLFFTSLLLPATRVAMGQSPGSSHPTPWPNKVRRGMFLALKIILLQPVMLSGFVVLILVGPVVPMATQLGIFSMWILALRWVLIDQRQRCPVCLRLLTSPVRIGTASQTFLEWYGAESTCSRGHGLLHVAEISSSYSGNPAWLRLGSSWSSLFSEAAVRRR